MKPKTKGKLQKFGLFLIYSNVVISLGTVGAAIAHFFDRNQNLSEFLIYPSWIIAFSTLLIYFEENGKKKSEEIEKLEKKCGIRHGWH